MDFDFTSIINQPFSTQSVKWLDQFIVFSHLRWDFVYQRPQHLATRLAAGSKLYFIEEPVFDAGDNLYYHTVEKNGIHIMVPHLRPGLSHQFTVAGLSQLFYEFITPFHLTRTGFWYYTPMALEFSADYTPAITVYDCMDELSAFKFAAANMQTLEKELLKKADLVFTGGKSLFEAKKNSHHNIHAFPSSIDKEHFFKARSRYESPEDQAKTDSPKLGFYGVIDERFDIELIKGIAEARPDWQIILLGPIVKIDPASLPDNPNIYYLGPKNYLQLPDYMTGWDIALIPFLMNESTRFISPTKTPEYLAAGLPVISTTIADVIDPYGINDLVHIGNNAEEFISLAEQILTNPETESERFVNIDNFLSLISWDYTFEGMENEISKVIAKKKFTHLNGQYTQLPDRRGQIAGFPVGRLTATDERDSFAL
jgi:glycosyltransferase involved in cell wall biosynthesis